jgi:hypothetical protein
VRKSATDTQFNLSHSHSIVCTYKQTQRAISFNMWVRLWQKIQQWLKRLPFLNVKIIQQYNTLRAHRANMCAILSILSEKGRWRLKKKCNLTNSNCCGKLQNNAIKIHHIYVISMWLHIAQHNLPTHEWRIFIFCSLNFSLSLTKK